MTVPGHIEVRMRDDDSSDSFPITSWPIDDLDRLVNILDQWGNPIEASACGQMSYDRSGQWFFEIVMAVGG